MSNKSVLGASQNCVLSVDLQNKDQAAQVVKDCHINLKRRNFFIGLMRAPKPVKYRLEVAYNLDERLVVAKGESVLLLRYREFQGAAITLDVGKDAHVFDFQLYFDAAKIVDCTEKEGMGTDEFAISYTIRAVRVDTNEVAQTIKGEATIKLQKLTFAAPKIEFRPNKVGENLVYNLLTTQPLEIGQLRVRNAADLLRNPASTIQMRVVARRVVGKRQLSVDELMWFGKDIKQTHPRAVATDNALTPLSGDASNFKFEMMSRDEVVLSYIDVNKAQSDSARNDNEVVVISGIMSGTTRGSTLPLSTTLSFSSQKLTSRFISLRLRLSVANRSLYVTLLLRFISSSLATTASMKMQYCSSSPIGFLTLLISHITGTTTSLSLRALSLCALFTSM